MSVSGESISVSCNHLSSESTGSGVKGEEGPQSIEGNVYAVEGDEVIGYDEILTSTANCNGGDTVTGGSFNYHYDGFSVDFNLDVQGAPTTGLHRWQVTAHVTGITAIQATAMCFDNP